MVQKRYNQMIFLSHKYIIKIYKYHQNKNGIISRSFLRNIWLNSYQLWFKPQFISNVVLPKHHFPLFLQMFRKFLQCILTKYGDDGIIRIHKWLNRNVCRRNNIVIRLYHNSNELITFLFLYSKFRHACGCKFIPYVYPMKHNFIKA